MTGISTLAQALGQLERIKDQQALFSTLSTQLTTGKKTQKFSGLGADVLVSKRSRADFSSLDTYINNITHANNRINMMMNAIQEFKAQAQILADTMNGFSQISVHQEGDVVYEFDDPTTSVIETDDPLTAEIEETLIPRGLTSDQIDGEFQTLREMAADVFRIFKDLLNAKEGDRYLLAGADTLTPPLGNMDGLSSAMGTLIDGWKNGSISNDEFFADLSDRTATAGNSDAITDMIIGYSASLSAGTAGNIYVRVGESAEIEYTTLANDQSFRDILVAASYLLNDSLPPIADVYEPPNSSPGTPDVEGAPGETLDEMKNNFFDVFNQVASMLNTALDRIDSVEFSLESARARMLEVKDSHQAAQNFLTDTIASVEDADINEVAVKLNILQVSLDAAFRVTARMQELSLVNYF